MKGTRSDWSIAHLPFPHGAMSTKGSCDQNLTRHVELRDNVFFLLTV